MEQGRLGQSFEGKTGDPQVKKGGEKEATKGKRQLCDPKTKGTGGGMGKNEAEKNEKDHEWSSEKSEHYFENNEEILKCLTGEYKIYLKI